MYGLKASMARGYGHMLLPCKVLERGLGVIMILSEHVLVRDPFMGS